MASAAFRWLSERYEPARRAARAACSGPCADPAELYCQVLEHKWFLSERAQHDVGLETAIEDYLARFRPADGAAG